LQVIKMDIGMDVSSPNAISPQFEEGPQLEMLGSLSEKRQPEATQFEEKDPTKEQLNEILANFGKHSTAGLYWDARNFEPTKPFYDFLQGGENLEAFPDSAFHSPKDGPRDYNFSTKVETVDMKLLESSFVARIQIGTWFKATRSEVRMALEGEDFGKPEIRFVNAVGDASNAGGQWEYNIAYFPKFGVWIKIANLPYVQETFQETFELQSFPFDVQDLNIKMTGPRVQCCNLVPDKMKPKPICLGVSLFSETDWVYESTMCEFFNDEGFSEVHLHIKTSRRWQHYFYRIYSILTLCALSGVLTFSFDIEENYTDAVGYMSTCLLTVVAFMFIVSSTIPPIPYLTFLDALVFITLTFVFMLLFVLALFKIENHGMSESGVLQGSIITWGAIQVIFVIASIYLKRKEKKKLQMGTRELNELFEEKKDDFISGEDCRVFPYKRDS